MILEPEPIAPDPELLSFRNIKDSVNNWSVAISVRSTPYKALVSAWEGLSGKKATKTEVGGVDAYKLDWVESGRSVKPNDLYNLKIIIPYQGFSYDISLYLDDKSSKKESYLNIFDQILSTFRFTE